MKTIAWGLLVGLLAFLVARIYLYLSVNLGHIGAWCDSPDNCSGSPEMGGILLVSLLAGMTTAGLVVGAIRLRRRN
jgi:hypothetical protein